MALISQRAYARQRGLTPEAVRKRTIDQGGMIPTYGYYPTGLASGVSRASEQRSLRGTREIERPRLLVSV